MRNKSSKLLALLIAANVMACSDAVTTGSNNGSTDAANGGDATLAGTDAAVDDLAVNPDGTDLDAQAVADVEGTDAVALTDVQAGPDAAVDAASDVAVTPDAGGALPDPNKNGPYTYGELDDKAQIAASGDSVAVHCAYPTAGPSAGPYPVVVIAHGMQLTPDKYYEYARRLATFGYVAVTVDFPTDLFLGNDNPKEAQDLAGALDWAANKGGVLFGKVDEKNAGAVGHSLGGKLAFLAATMEPRFKAVIGLDPVDGGGPLGCNPPKCVDVTDAIGKLTIPTGFVGEMTDASGGMQPCAPMASNYETFYNAIAKNSFEVTVNGANHMSFLDNQNGCMACGFCNKATANATAVTDLARSYVTAFFERHLRGLTAYDDYLTGATAQARYVKTGLATIDTK